MFITTNTQLRVNIFIQINLINEAKRRMPSVNSCVTDCDSFCNEYFEVVSLNIYKAI